MTERVSLRGGYHRAGVTAIHHLTMPPLPGIPVRLDVITALVAGLGCASAAADVDGTSTGPWPISASESDSVRAASWQTAQANQAAVAAPAAPATGQPAAGETAPGADLSGQPQQPWGYDRLPQPYPTTPADAERVNVLIGVAANTSPNFFGGRSQHFKLKPVAALQWGRWRLSTGGGYGLMAQGRRDRGAGAQAVLTETDRFNLSLSLNIDRGRDVADTERLKGVPDVRGTLRARVRARYNFTERLAASLAASHDILGRGRGMEIDGWLGYRLPISEATRVDFGIGASWGNSQYMRSQFGIPQAAAVPSGYPAFKPGGGLYQTELGVDVAHALSRSWVLFGGLRYAQLHGDARRSPLTLRSNGLSATVGIAWRN